MPNYYVNRQAQANGDHEVHKDGCSYMPNQDNRLYLGNFSTCQEAVREAKRYFSQSNGCFFVVGNAILRLYLKDGGIAPR